ncbi:MAG: aminotransferase [Paracoccus denitrificans]|nr:MAG: aminotransferase [Paracoccus denitrificans]PZO86240.1 MAG: aminotransferase [Paracoccus denitrificans]
MTHDIFARFRASLGTDPLDALHDGLIGRDAVIDGPFGPRRMIYADYIASGRALRQVEEFVMTEVLPWYANSHTEASHCGGTMTRMRRAARAEILRCTGGDAETHAAIFTGSGATAGINRLVHLWAVGPDTTVILGPYEHHSNILPWRESGAHIIDLPEAACGGPCPDALADALSVKGPKVVALSACSNITGITCDVAELTKLAKLSGARVLWDYAGGAPYLPIDMALGMDAVVASPHKFVGGPGASGVLILRRDSVQSQVPSLPGGGTVRFVSPHGHDYATGVEAREEAGTPNVVGDIRAALVFALKDAVGQSTLDARHAAWWAKAQGRLRDHDRIELLGNRDCPRVPILSFRLRDGRGGHIHQQLATRMLSDLYGIQARGGCACAGPYVHSLLGMDRAESDRLRHAILSGVEIEKPGFVRLNLCWLAPEAEIDAILNALDDLSHRAPDLVANYGCDTSRAIFSPLAA